MQKTDLLKASKADKLRFYRKEFFEDTQTMKRGLFFIIFGIYTCETLHDLFIIPTELYGRTQTSQIVTGTAYIVISLCFYVSLFKEFKQSSDKIFRIRYWISFLGTIALSLSLAYNTFFVMKQNLKFSWPDGWLYALITERSEVWMVLIIDLVVPIWYMKLLVPTSYWVVQAIFYHQQDFEYEGMIWERFLLFTIYTTLLWGVKAYIQWKTFLGNINANAWSGIQKCILDRVPDAIAVVDIDCKVYYSNNSFKSLCNNDLENLSQRILEIKKSGGQQDPKKYSEDLGDSETKSSKNLESTARSKTEDKLESLNNIETIMVPFIDLLKTIMNSVAKNEYNPSDLLTFIAKGKSQQSSNDKPYSYEIKIIPLIEYKKIILMLDNTTQRDLAISLEAINKYKDKLLATVSHDLRAPINGSLTFIDNSIEHKAVPTFIKEQFLIPAQRSCKFLLHLVNDFLDLAQINARKLRISCECLSIVDTIKNCFQLVEIPAHQKSLNISLDIDPKIPSEFNTDHHRVSQIIINLLTNAIKFTSKGFIWLRAKAINDSLIEIQVIDTGLGMKEEDQKKLFTEFTRIQHEDADLNNRGVGLGLVIANQLACLLGPKDEKAGIKVVSTYGKGSTFSFLLEEKDFDLSKPKILTSRRPQRKDVKSRVSFAVLPEEGVSFNEIEELETSRHKISYRRPYITIFHDNNTSLSNLSKTHGRLDSSRYQSDEKDQFRVLVVDDDPLNVLALTSLLKHYGITADAAFNGEEAIEKVANIGSPTKNSHLDSSREPWNRDKKTSDYKLIFMDCEMPVMDGCKASETLTAMMNNGEIKFIPIIGCTGHKDEEKLASCLNSGMSEVISKPVSRDRLKAYLDKYLNLDPTLNGL